MNMVELPIQDHFFRSSSAVLHFESAVRVRSQPPEIIFEVQMKRSNEKIARRKISCSTYKTPPFFFSFFLDPSYFQSF